MTFRKSPFKLVYCPSIRGNIEDQSRLSGGLSPSETPPVHLGEHLLLRFLCYRAAVPFAL